MLTYSFENIDTESMYEHLYRCIKQDILQKKLRAGEKLPSKRTFAKNLGVSTITVESAYAQLVAEGFLYTLPKRGYYVCELEREEPVAPLPPRPKGPAPREPDKRAYWADFVGSSVARDMFPFSVWVKLLRDVTAGEDEATLLTDTSAGGIRQLRQAISDHLYQFRGMTIDPEQIVVGAGIEYLLGCLAHLFGDGMAAIENPGYSRTRTVLQNSGIPCTLVDIDREGLPADALEKSGANLCYLTPSHHFPTGVTMPAPRRAQLLAWAAAKPGRYILEDDYDSEFRFDTRPLPSLQGMAGPDGPVVYLTTFSKSLAPGIRIACMVLPQSLLARYRRDFATYANTVSRFEQQTLCEFMAGGYFTRHLARMRLAYKRRMEAFAAALRAALPGAELDGVHSGLHFLLTLPGAGGERAMVEAAARQGVRLRGLSEYYLARPELCRPDTVVAGYSALREEDVEKVAQALARAWLCAPGNG